MTTPVNIYLLSRCPDEDSFNVLEQCCLRDKKPDPTGDWEIKSLQRLVDELFSNGLSISDMDGFFYSFKIPHISREFDLLKITDNLCLNIELKSTDVGEEKIREQLLENRYYLSPLERGLKLYSVVTDTMKCYEFFNDELKQVELTEILTQIKELSMNCSNMIDDLFKPSAYLVSPLNKPEEFLQGNYFLTEHQKQIKKEIIDSSSSRGIFLLSGRAGTGKTLLIYDLAKTMAKTISDSEKKTLIIHCQKLPSNFYEKIKKIENLNIIEVKDLRNINLSDYSYIFVDESQRLYPNTFKQIRDSTEDRLCVFSFDSEQILSQKERDSNIVSQLRELSEEEFKLTDKIRTNEEVSNFISHVMDLKSQDEVFDAYPGIDLCYADDYYEVCYILDYYRNKGYTFINYSKSNYPKPNDFNPYLLYSGAEDYDTHHVIGQEFDNVVMLMDSSFYYDENGLLQGKEHPNPDYLYNKLFYQGATRAREGLAIVVTENPELFKKMVAIIKPANLDNKK